MIYDHHDILDQLEENPIYGIDIDADGFYNEDYHEREEPVSYDDYEG